MVWSLSMQLLPGEEVLEESSWRPQGPIKAAYSVVLTNKRTLFRFNGFGSSLVQAFSYDEMLEVKACRRLFVNYLFVKTRGKDYFLNIPEPDHWTERIRQAKERFESAEAAGRRPAGPARRKRELLDMLMALRKSALLTDAELDEKVRLLDSMDV